MAVKPQTQRLYTDIKKEFNRMSNVKEFGVSKYSTEYILNYLANKFYKSQKTIENIVFDRVVDTNQKETPQQSLF